MQSLYRLNGVIFKRPDIFKIERFILTNLQRTASGEMFGDFIAKKRKFYFTYNGITAKDLNVIFDILWETTTLFHTLSYVENGIIKTARVYVGAMPTDLHRTGTNWVWKNVTFNLIEK